MQHQKITANCGERPSKYRENRLKINSVECIYHSKTKRIQRGAKWYENRRFGFCEEKFFKKNDTKLFDFWQSFNDINESPSNFTLRSVWWLSCIQLMQVVCHIFHHCCQYPTGSDQKTQVMQTANTHCICSNWFESISNKITGPPLLIERQSSERIIRKRSLSCVFGDELARSYVQWWKIQNKRFFSQIQ